MRTCVFLWLAAVIVALSSAQTIALSSEKGVYLEDDVRALHEAIIAPAGERVVLNAVINGLVWTGPGCPLLRERVRLPNGSEQDYELGDGARCIQDADGRVQVKFNAGHLSHWFGLGEYHIRLALDSKYVDPEKPSPISNEIALTMADAAMIKRDWGRKDRGVAVDLSLEKGAFALGEDVALHIAVENFDADVPIYGFSPLWDPFSAVKIEVLESDGRPVKQTCARFWQGGGPSAMWRYPKGMIVPIERSLAGDGFLPDHPGTFTVSVTWNAYRGDDDKCHACQVSDKFDFTPYAVAHSGVKSFKITEGPTPPIPCL